MKLSEGLERWSASQVCQIVSVNSFFFVFFELKCKILVVFSKLKQLCKVV